VRLGSATGVADRSAPARPAWPRCQRPGQRTSVSSAAGFLHQLAAVIWPGDILAANVQQARTGTGNDRAAQAPPPRQSDLYGRAVITPAAAVVLLSGVVLVLQDDISRGALDEFWIVWALTAVLGSLILGRR